MPEPRTMRVLQPFRACWTCCFSAVAELGASFACSFLRTRRLSHTARNTSHTRPTPSSTTTAKTQTNENNIALRCLSFSGNAPTKRFYSFVSSPPLSLLSLPSPPAYVLVVDPATNTTLSPLLDGLGVGGDKAVGGALAGNGLVYAFPHTADHILVIHPGC